MSGMNEGVSALIMAGGRGERLWPMSRYERPKQFISFTKDGRSMIRLTVDRMLQIMKPERIFIATNEDYRALAERELPELPPENIICEPMARNTAACIGLGAVHIKRRFGNATMIVLPSDHMILNTQLFLDTIMKAVELARKDSRIVTLGITPEGPDTNYGYIHFRFEEQDEGAYRVRRFVEKPDYATAKEYVRTGEYLWNSGMFIWSTDTILASLREYLPDTAQRLERIGAAIGTEAEAETLRTEFAAMKSISVDYGVLEHATDIYTIPSSFGWDDVGAWGALERINEVDEDHNLFFGNVWQVESHDCIVKTEGKPIALVDVEGLVVVDAGDVTLVCRKKDASDIKKMVEKLRESGHTEYI